MKTNNQKLAKARKNQNDEFYTRLEDIQKELKHYHKFFKNKIVMLPFDKKISQFWVYFVKNFKKLELKKLIATNYKTDKPTHKLIYDGKNITKHQLKQNGDFCSDEVQNIIKKEVDIIISNPPFSIFHKKIVPLLNETKKDFILIVNKGIVVYKKCFPKFKSGEWKFGYEKIDAFYDMQKQETKKIQGLTRWITTLPIKKFGNISWITNLPIEKKKLILKLEKKYNSNDYPKFDHYDAINVDRIKDIPKDYFEPMGVPIGIFDYWNPEKFEIIGITELWDIGARAYIKSKLKYDRIIIKFKIIDAIHRYSALEGPTKETKGKFLSKVNGKQLFSRIIIKRRKNE